jgi:hypothetical protein
VKPACPKIRSLTLLLILPFVGPPYCSNVVLVVLFYKQQYQICRISAIFDGWTSHRRIVGHDALVANGVQGVILLKGMRKWFGKQKGIRKVEEICVSNGLGIWFCLLPVALSCSTNVETCMLREDGREVRVWIQSASTYRAYEYSWGKCPRLCIFNELISILQILRLFSHSSGQLYTLSGSRRSPRLSSQCMSSLGSMWIEDCTRYAVWIIFELNILIHPLAQLVSWMHACGLHFSA